VYATSDPGYYLDSWELDNAYVGIFNPECVTMNKNHTLQAVFEPLEIGHDIATRWVVSKSVVGQGFNLSIQVTVINTGSYSENFNVTAYLNSTSTTPQDVTLDSGASTTLILTLNTSSFSYGNYTISAYAEPVSGETDTADNNLTGGWVIVSIKGDLTGGTPNAWDFVPDGQVDIVDVAVVVKCFGQKVPPAPANCDVSGATVGVPDGKIDITDVATVAKHFGEHYP
jgi:hypothetical protein